MLCIAVAAFEASHSRLLDLSSQVSDLRAFYCGGKVLDAGGDPYRLEPLRTCEHETTGLPLLQNQGFALPVTTPGYDLLLLRVLSHVPFSSAVVLWTTMEIGAVGITMLLLARTLAVPIGLAGATLVLSDGLASIIQGQLMPFEMLFIAATGLAVSRNLNQTAALLAIGTLIDPHIGLPICLAMLVLMPLTRLRLSIGIAALIGIDFAFNGSQRVTEYFHLAVPAQVTVELPYQEQYSLSYLLHFAGFSEPIARACGYVSYAALTGLGVLLASRLRGLPHLKAAAVFVPAAFSVIGGPYIHITQMCAAIPLALALVLVFRSGAPRLISWIALCLLSVPWPYPYSSKALLLASIVTVLSVLVHAGWKSWVWASATVLTLGAALIVLENTPRIVNPGMRFTFHAPSSPAQAAWSDYVAARETRDVAYFVVKCLTWAALMSLVFATSLLGLRTPRTLGVEREGRLRARQRLRTQPGK